MQALDPAGIYPDAEVIDALTGRYGTRVITYRYDRLNELNTYVEPLDWVLSGTVSNNALADIKRTAKFTVLDRGSINYLKDRIKPWARLAMPDGGKVEWPLGVFLLATPERVLDEVGTVTREVEAYDQLLVLNDDKVVDRYSVAAGALYTTAMAALVAAFSYSIIPSALTLPAALEWPPGTPKLRILNDLLGAINYESAWFDESGRLICRPYQSPALRSSEYTYDTSATRGMLTGSVRQGLDLFSVPNKWVLVKSEADQPTIVGTYTNTSTSSPTSTLSRGRTIVDVREEQDAADQTTIDAKAARLGFESSQVFENVAFTTAAMPMHSNADVLNLDIPGLALLGSEIFDRRRQVDRFDAEPAHAHHGLRVKIKTPHPALPMHDLAQRRYRIDPKAKQRITNAGPQGFQIGPAVGHLAAVDTQTRRVRGEHRHTQHHDLAPGR